MNKLTNSDYKRAAEFLECEVAAIKAVAEVESRGDGFDSSGRVKILFERHKFFKYTSGKYRKSHPHLCNPNAGGYGSERVQYAKFAEAFALDKLAAMLSCSWGKFQIMGFNYRVCGFSNVTEFVEVMKRGEGEQLMAFCRFVKSQNLATYLKSKNWAKFASRYNGANYRKNRYDEKMADFYAKFKKEKIIQSKPAMTATPVPPSPTPEPVVLTPAEPQVLTPTEPAKDDSFLSAALDKNVSGDEVKTAARTAAPKILARFARPFGLLYLALEAGNVYAWLGVLAGVIAVGLLIYWHRDDFKKIWQTIKTKFTA